MADIRIEKKNKFPWLWILGLLVLALAAWFIIEGTDDDLDDVAVAELEDDYAVGVPVEDEYEDEGVYVLGETTTGVRDYEDEVQAYLDYTNNMEGMMDLSHEFSHTALTRLANSVIALAAANDLSTNANIEQRAGEVKQLVDDILKDPYAGTHADTIQAAASRLAYMLSVINNEVFSGQFNSQVMALQQEAETIDEATLTLNQKKDVRTFFGEARNLLESMWQTDLNS